MLAEKGKVGREAMAGKRAGMMKVPTGVKKKAGNAGNFQVWFNKDYVGTFSTLSLALCAPRNVTVADPCENALWDGRRICSARATRPAPQKHGEEHYELHFLPWARNEKARQWNATVADPCEKYALWDVPPEDMLSFERRDPRWTTPPA